MGYPVGEWAEIPHGDRTVKEGRNVEQGTQHGRRWEYVLIAVVAALLVWWLSSTEVAWAHHAGTDQLFTGTPAVTTAGCCGDDWSYGNRILFNQSGTVDKVYVYGFAGINQTLGFTTASPVGSLLTSTSWTPGSTGWFEHTLPSPVAVTAGVEYHFWTQKTPSVQNHHYLTTGYAINTTSADGHYTFKGGYNCGSCTNGAFNPGYALSGFTAPIIPIFTGSVSTSDFTFEEDGRRVLEVVGAAGTDALVEANTSIGGVNGEFDWSIDTRDSVQRPDNLRSQKTTSRNEVNYTDCITTVVYEVVPWEASDLPTTQWHAKFTLDGVQSTCGGGTGYGIVRVPTGLTGVVIYDPYTGSCMAPDQDSRRYFDEGWSCTYVLVAGVLQSAPFPSPTAVITPVVTPTPIPAVGTATPAPTVAQNNSPDVAGAINRQTNTQQGWFSNISDRLNELRTEVSGMPQRMASEVATVVGVPGSSYMADKSDAAGALMTERVGPVSTAQAGIGAVVSSIPDSPPDCAAYAGVTWVLPGVAGNNITWTFFSGPVMTDWYCPTVKPLLALAVDAAIVAYLYFRGKFFMRTLK